MSEDLTKPEQLLMWELFAAGGAKLLKDIVPKPKGAEAALAENRFLKVSKHGRTKLFELEDRGWRWIADCDPFPIGSDEKKVTAERRLLQSLTRGIKRYAAANGRTIPELFRVEPQVPRPTASRVATKKPAAKKSRVAAATARNDVAQPDTGRDLPGEIREAFFAIAGRPPCDSVRLSALRAKLPHVTNADLDRALLAMRDAHQANLMNLDNPRDIEGEAGAELRAGRQVFHTLWIDA